MQHRRYSSAEHFVQDWCPKLSFVGSFAVFDGGFALGLVCINKVSGLMNRSLTVFAAFQWENFWVFTGLSASLKDRLARRVRVEYGLG